MRIIDTIMSSILGTRAQPPPPPATAAAGMAPPAPAQESAPPVAPTPSPAQAPEPAPTPSYAQPPPASAAAPVDVAAVLDARAEETDQELNWRTSIVDLMKLLKLDSSSTARKALAKELKYTGDTDDSAAMNIWLHKQVMAKLVEGGGRLPSDVRH
jgi:type IV secretory pathway VirB10-like protein